MLWILVGLAFGLASAAIAAQRSIAAVVLGAAGVVIFIGLSAAPLALYLTRSGPGLVVDDDGFDDRSTPCLSAGRVWWTEVLAVYPLQLNRQWFIVIHLRHPEVYLARQNWLFRKSARANLALVGSPITLTANNLKTDTESLFTLLDESFQRHLRQESHR